MYIFPIGNCILANIQQLVLLATSAIGMATLTTFLRLLDWLHRLPVMILALLVTIVLLLHSHLFAHILSHRVRAFLAGRVGLLILFAPLSVLLSTAAVLVLAAAVIFTVANFVVFGHGCCFI